jgi:hypothetical protein
LLACCLWSRRMRGAQCSLNVPRMLTECSINVYM